MISPEANVCSYLEQFGPDAPFALSAYEVLLGFFSYKTPLVIVEVD